MYHSVNPQTVESAFSWLHASQSGQSVSKLASQSASQSVSQPFSKSVGQLVSHSVSKSVSQSVSQSLASWAVSHSASKSVGQPASQSVSQWGWLYEPQCRLHVWSNPHSVLHLFIFMWKSWELWTKLPNHSANKIRMFLWFSNFSFAKFWKRF